MRHKKFDDEARIVAAIYAGQIIIFALGARTRLDWSGSRLFELTCCLSLIPCMCRRRLNPPQSVGAHRLRCWKRSVPC